MILRLITGMLVLSLLATPAVSSAAVLQISPQTAPDCHEEFEKVANALQPGDELILRGGKYSQSCRRAITVNGTAAAPIVIRAATGERPLITRPADNIDTQNNIEIVNSSHLIIRGLAFQGGSTGVRFIGGHHITLEDSEIYETGNNAISLNYGNTDYFVFRRNHIHHTGLSTSGPTEGEGFYAGCNNDTCRITNSLIEGNYIHHLRGTSDGGNDGIEIKVGSYNNVVRNNVIHDTTIGRRYPCIFVYGGGHGLNIVEGNVMWNCGEAIQVVSDAMIRNNIILSSDIGITATPHIQIAQMRNVTIANNTLYGHGRCLSIQWDVATSMTLANNAIFCPGAIAVDASGLGGRSIMVRANYVEGGLAGASLNQSQFFSGGTAATAFTDPQTRDFWPRATGSLVGKSDAAFTPANDVNERPRGAPADVGAYEANGLASNPGWRIVPGFKQTPLRRGGVRRSTGPSLVVAVASFRSHQCAAGWSPPALPAGASAARRSAWTWRRRFRTRARRGGSRPRGSGLRPRRRLGGFVSQQHSLSARALGVLRTTLRRRRRPTPPRSLEGLEGGERAIEFRIDGLLVAEPSLGS